MIEADRILPFLLTAIVIILIPGPQVLFIVGRAFAYGRRTAMASAAGGTAGQYVQALLVSLGLGTLVERSALVYAALKLAGAAYLVFLGVRAFRHRRRLTADVDQDAGRAPAPATAVQAARQGMLVGVTNPKITVFFAAILPQFVDRARGEVPLQMILFASMFAVLGLACDCGWGLAAGTARDWFARSPRRLALVGGAGGLAMVGLGVGIAATGRTD